MLLSEQAYKKIDRELAKFPADQRQSAVMAALAIAQDETSWLSPEVMQELADYIGMPAIAVQEVATFYNMYNTKPVGKHKISVCTNLPCALSGGEKAALHLKHKLGIDFRETTADGQFTLVSCAVPGHTLGKDLTALGNELLHHSRPPYCWDDATKKKFNHILGLLELCNASQQIYLSLPSWETVWHEKLEKKGGREAGVWVYAYNRPKSWEGIGR